MFDRIEISDEKLRGIEERIYKQLKGYVNDEYYRGEIAKSLIDQIQRGWFPNFFEFIVQKINALQLKGGSSGE